MTNFTNSGIAVDPQLVWRQFHQNNWKNSSITPKVKFVKIDKTTNNILISTDYVDAEYDYVARVFVRPDIKGRSNEERKRELLKQKRYNEVYETVIYEKVQSEVDMGDGAVAVFRPIQKLGDGFRFVEVYTDNRPSILPQNHTVDLNTGALQNTHIPENNITITTPGSVVKPVIPQQTEPLVVASAQSKFFIASQPGTAPQAAPTQAPVSSTSQTDQQIRNSPEYKQWLANNSNPLMSEQENFEYYKKCNL
jgi:hypothetical protein